MSTRFALLWKRFRLVVALAAAGPPNAVAQILVSAQGSALLTFDTAPAVQEWATQSFGGDSGGGEILDAAGLDAHVQMVSKAVVVNPLATSDIVPPAQNNYARWNSRGAFLQSRIGNNDFAVMVATLINNTGMPVMTLGVSYELGGGLSAGEQVPGFRAYVSLSGQGGTWQVVTGLCTGTTGLVAAVFAVEGAWLPGAPLYLLWADDNGLGTDGYYTVDNLRIHVAPALELRAVAGRVEISWPQAWWNHQLESTGSLSAPDWRLAIGLFTQTNGVNRMSFDAATGNRFFRSRGDIVLP